VNTVSDSSFILRLRLWWSITTAIAACQGKKHTPKRQVPTRLTLTRRRRGVSLEDMTEAAIPVRVTGELQARLSHKVLLDFEITVQDRLF
jgi:hypothetical protein